MSGSNRSNRSLNKAFITHELSCIEQIKADIHVWMFIIVSVPAKMPLLAYHPSLPLPETCSLSLSLPPHSINARFPRWRCPGPRSQRAAFVVLAGPLTVRHWQEGRRDWQHAGWPPPSLGWWGRGSQIHHTTDKLTWVWSKCHPRSFYSSVLGCLFQMTCAVVLGFLQEANFRISQLAWNVNKDMEAALPLLGTPCLIGFKATPQLPAQGPGRGGTNEGMPADSGLDFHLFPGIRCEISKVQQPSSLIPQHLSWAHGC